MLSKTLITNVGQGPVVTLLTPSLRQAPTHEESHCIELVGAPTADDRNPAWPTIYIYIYTILP